MPKTKEVVLPGPDDVVLPGPEDVVSLPGPDDVVLPGPDRGHDIKPFGATSASPPTGAVSMGNAQTYAPSMAKTAPSADVEGQLNALREKKKNSGFLKGSAIDALTLVPEMVRSLPELPGQIVNHPFKTAFQFTGIPSVARLTPYVGNLTGAGSAYEDNSIVSDVAGALPVFGAWKALKAGGRAIANPLKAKNILKDVVTDPKYKAGNDYYSAGNQIDDISSQLSSMSKEIDSLGEVLTKENIPGSIPKELNDIYKKKYDEFTELRARKESLEKLKETLRVKAEIPDPNNVNPYVRRETTLNSHYEMPSIEPVSGWRALTAQARSIVSHGPVEDVGLAKTKSIPLEITSQDSAWGMDKARILQSRMSKPEIKQVFKALTEGTKETLTPVQEAFVTLYRRGQEMFYQEALKFDPKLKREKFYVHRIYDNPMVDIELGERVGKGITKPKLEAGMLKERTVQEPTDLIENPMYAYDRAHYELARQKYLRPALERSVKFLQENKAEFTPTQWRLAKLWVDVQAGKAWTFDKMMRGMEWRGYTIKDMMDNLATGVYSANLTGNFGSAAWNLTQSALYYGVRHPFRYASGTVRAAADLAKHVVWKASGGEMGKKSHLIGNQRMAATMTRGFSADLELSHGMSAVTDKLLRAMPIGWVEPFLRGQVFYGEFNGNIAKFSKELRRALTDDEIAASRKMAYEKVMGLSPEEIHMEMIDAGIPEESLLGRKRTALEKAGLSAPKENRMSLLAATRKTVNTNFLPGSVEGNPVMYTLPSITRIFSKYPTASVDLMTNWIKGDFKALQKSVDSLVHEGKMPAKDAPQVMKELLKGEDRGMSPLYLGMGALLTMAWFGGNKETKKMAENIAYQAGPTGWLRAATAGPVPKELAKAFQNPTVAANLGAMAAFGMPIIGPDANAEKILKGQQSSAEMVPYRGVRDLLYLSGIAKDKRKKD